MSNYLNKNAKREIRAIEEDIKFNLRVKRPHWNQLVVSYLHEIEVHHGKKAVKETGKKLKLKKHGWEEFK